MLEAFRTLSPSTSCNREATKQIAFVYRESGQLSRAAGEYERVAAESEDPGIARRGAARRRRPLRAVEGTDRARSTCTRATSSSSRGRSRRPSRRASRSPRCTRRRTTRRATTTGAAADRRASTRPPAPSGPTARARSRRARRSVLAEQLYREFAAVKLLQPFEASLQEKQAAHGRRDRGLRAAWSTTRSADVTAAATFYMAETYSDFSRSLIESERPGGPAARGAAGVRAGARGGGVSVRGEGHRRAREEPGADARRRLQRLDREEPRQARRADAGALREGRGEQRLPRRDRQLRVPRAVAAAARAGRPQAETPAPRRRPRPTRPPTPSSAARRARSRRPPRPRLTLRRAEALRRALKPRGAVRGGPASLAVLAGRWPPPARRRRRRRARRPGRHPAGRHRVHDHAGARARGDVRADYEQPLRLLEQQQYEQGIALLVKVTERRPRDSAAHRSRHRLRAHRRPGSRRGEPRSKALELNPRPPAAYNELGMVYRRQGQFADARASYEKALRLSHISTSRTATSRSSATCISRTRLRARALRGVQPGRARTTGGREVDRRPATGRGNRRTHADESLISRCCCSQSAGDEARRGEPRRVTRRSNRADDGRRRPAAAPQTPKGDGDKSLSGMSILGNQEAPKSLVIVPWKSSEIGDRSASRSARRRRGSPSTRTSSCASSRYYEIRSSSK